MKVLLDTHTYLWLRAGPERLGAFAADAITSNDTELYLSIVSLWEMTIKSVKKQLTLPADGIAAVAAELPSFGITLLDVGLDDIVALEALPLIHRDPFDRLLVAQAVVGRYVLLTEDSWMREYGVTTMWE